MTDTVICGTIGLDDIKTPFGIKKATLGGSAVYSSFASSFFKKPGIVSIAGKDLSKENLALLSRIDLAGLSFGKKTFRWQGLYEYDMNEAKTLKTELNSLAGFSPNLPLSYKKARFLLLANIDPEIQLKILEQINSKALVLIDSMNFWIENKKEALISAIKKADIVLFNDAEAREFFNTPNLIKAGRELLNLGPEYAIIKKGEHGALLFSYDRFFSAPGYPLEVLKDPTGAGDSFAGGLIGYLSCSDKINEAQIRKGIIYGSVIASFCTEGLGLENLIKIKLKDIKERYEVMRQIREF